MRLNSCSALSFSYMNFKNTVNLTCTVPIYLDMYNTYLTGQFKYAIHGVASEEHGLMFLLAKNCGDSLENIHE